MWQVQFEYLTIKRYKTKICSMLVNVRFGSKQICFFCHILSKCDKKNLTVFAWYSRSLTAPTFAHFWASTVTRRFREYIPRIMRERKMASCFQNCCGFGDKKIHKLTIQRLLFFFFRKKAKIFFLLPLTGFTKRPFLPSRALLMNLFYPSRGFSTPGGTFYVVFT